MILFGICSVAWPCLVVRGFHVGCVLIFVEETVRGAFGDLGIALGCVFRVVDEFFRFCFLFYV